MAQEWRWVALGSAGVALAAGPVARRALGVAQVAQEVAQEWRCVGRAALAAGPVARRALGVAQVAQEWRRGSSGQLRAAGMMRCVALVWRRKTLPAPLGAGWRMDAR